MVACLQGGTEAADASLAEAGDDAQLPSVTTSGQEVISLASMPTSMEPATAEVAAGEGSAAKRAKLTAVPAAEAGTGPVSSSVPPVPTPAAAGPSDAQGGSSWEPQPCPTQILSSQLPQMLGLCELCNIAQVSGALVYILRC